MTNYKCMAITDVARVAWIVALFMAILIWASCAAFRQHAEQARAATAAVIEAPQRVESGATVTEALGAAVTANIEKTDKVADAVDTIGKIVQQQDSWSQRLAVFGLIGLVAMGIILDNRRDRRRFHRNGSESKGIVR